MWWGLRGLNGGVAQRRSLAAACQEAARCWAEPPWGLHVPVACPFHVPNPGLRKSAGTRMADAGCIGIFPVGVVFGAAGGALLGRAADAINLEDLKGFSTRSRENYRPGTQRLLPRLLNKHKETLIRTFRPSAERSFASRRQSPACCPRAASGHAAVPSINTNSRREASIAIQPPVDSKVYNVEMLARIDRTVTGRGT
jgi:hypothetical protein